MERRTFIKRAATALAAHGCLPLLAADREALARRVWGNSPNPYVEPCAIEPVTGVLPAFSPVVGAAMTGTFAAKYSLLAWQYAAEKSVNKPMGSMEVNFGNGRCQTTEKRAGSKLGPGCAIKTSVQFAGKSNTVTQWTLESQVDGREATVVRRVKAHTCQMSDIEPWRASGQALGECKSVLYRTAHIRR